MSECEYESVCVSECVRVSKSESESAQLYASIDVLSIETPARMLLAYIVCNNITLYYLISAPWPRGVVLLC